MKESAQMNRVESSLLLYLETRTVDYSGIYDPRHLNDVDRDILDKWKGEGFLDHGRVSSEYLTPRRCLWVRLSVEAVGVAAELRSRKADQGWRSRKWTTTEEKRNGIGYSDQEGDFCKDRINEGQKNTEIGV